METKNKFNFRDRITSKRIGPCMVGTIIGIMLPDFNILLPGNGFKDYYDHIDDKFFYQVLYDSPMVVFTKQELSEVVKRIFGDEIPEDFDADEVYSQYPKQLSAIYPEDDLELL